VTQMTSKSHNRFVGTLLNTKSEKKYSETVQRTPSARPAVVMETPVVKEHTPIAKKASAFIGTVTDAYQSPEPRGTVKTSDFDDVEGVKDRQKKWEEGQVVGSAGIKPPAEGYKLDETEQTKARKQKWEEGQVIGSEGIKQAVEGYKLDETEQTKARKQKWEEGQVIGSEGIKQAVEGYKLEENEEVKARKQKWEGGQVIGAAGTSTFQPEGYKLGESAGVKDRLNKYSAVASTVPIVKTDRSKPVPIEDESGRAVPPQTKDRLKQWEDGSVATSPTKDSTKSPVKVSEDDAQVDAVKERLNRWSEVTKDPEPGARKEPLKIYEDDPAPAPPPAAPSQ